MDRWQAPAAGTAMGGHRASPPAASAPVGEVLLDLLRLPAQITDLRAQGHDRVRVCLKFSGPGAAEEGGTVAAVQEPLLVLPPDEARRALRDGRSTSIGASSPGAPALK